MAGNQNVEAHGKGYRKGSRELAGRNESERIDGLESTEPRRLNPPGMGESNMVDRKLSETIYHFGGVVAMAC